jgi:CubicO group peptidase (beta-lactamase class C family)
MKPPVRHLRQRVLVALVITTCVAAHADPVDDYVREQMQKLHIPGLSIAVVKEGKLIKAAGYGVANVETRTPATAETVYKIASLSKPILATAVLLLVQDGKLGLDDKVGKYLPGSPESWKDITIRHLLTHTSGIVRDPADYHPYREQQPAEVIESVYPMPLSFQPGEKWLYSNVGYFVLSEIIGRVARKPWDEFVSERIFAPAGMTSTRTTNLAAIIPHRANGYEQKDGVLVNAENWIAVRPSGAFVSTVLDLAQWDIFMDSNRPLSALSRAQVQTPVALRDGKTADYGFGWYVGSFLGRARIHHDGQYPGFRSDYERFEADKLSVIVLANSGSSRVDSLAIKVAGFYVEALAMPPFTTSASVPVQPVPSGAPVAIKIAAKDDGKAAPDSVVEMEIWDESHNAVHKEDKTNESFAPNETKNYEFLWTPAKAGKYTVSVGVYGPRWTPSYSWNQEMVEITVR